MDKLEAQFEEVKKKYIAKLPEKFSEIQAVEEKLLSDGSNIDILSKLRLLVHSMCGSSGMFGLSSLSEKAYNLELYLKPCINDAQPCDLNKVESLLDELRKAYRELIG